MLAAPPQLLLGHRPPTHAPAHLHLHLHPQHRHLHLLLPCTPAPPAAAPRLRNSGVAQSRSAGAAGRTNVNTHQLFHHRRGLHASSFDFFSGFLFWISFFTGFESCGRVGNFGRVSVTPGRLDGPHDSLTASQHSKTFQILKLQKLPPTRRERKKRDM